MFKEALFLRSWQRTVTTFKTDAVWMRNKNHQRNANMSLCSFQSCKQDKKYLSLGKMRKKDTYMRRHFIYKAHVLYLTCHRRSFCSEKRNSFFSVCWSHTSKCEVYWVDDIFWFISQPKRRYFHSCSSPLHSDKAIWLTQWLTHRHISFPTFVNTWLVFHCYYYRYYYGALAQNPC